MNTRDRCVFVALMVLTTAQSATAHPLAPILIGGGVSVGYQQNVLGASGPELDGFRTGSADYLFLIDRVDDERGEVSIWGRWDVPSFYKSIRLEVGYGRTEFVHSKILGRGQFDFSLKQKLPDRSSLALKLRHEPQVYLRHRVDKDALPGEPRFRPEAVRKTEISLANARSLGSVRGIATVGYSEEDRNRWFNERDERGVYGGLAVEHILANGMTVRPSYEFNRTRSRNHPDLGSDRSYREHAVGFGGDVDLAIHGTDLHAEIAGRMKFRTYTTEDAQDASRYHRHDRMLYAMARITLRLPPLQPYIALEQGGRRVSLPPGAAANDEDGEYNSTFLRVGCDWQVDLSGIRGEPR